MTHPTRESTLVHTLHHMKQNQNVRPCPYFRAKHGSAPGAASWGRSTQMIASTCRSEVVARAGVVAAPAPARARARARARAPAPARARARAAARRGVAVALG
eukprot:scaffold54132_cov61-Phaeocystis_antarctica.AAC.2